MVTFFSSGKAAFYTFLSFQCSWRLISFNPFWINTLFFCNHLGIFWFNPDWFITNCSETNSFHSFYLLWLYLFINCNLRNTENSASTNSVKSSDGSCRYCNLTNSFIPKLGQWEWYLMNIFAPYRLGTIEFGLFYLEIQPTLQKGIRNNLS